jgi:hypothetical protein
MDNNVINDKIKIKHEIIDENTINNEIDHINNDIKKIDDEMRDIDHEMQEMNVKMNTINVYVNSFGGVGTSALIRWLTIQKIVTNCNKDSDGIKHLNTPNSLKLKDLIINKAIYIYDDPIDATISLFNRKFHISQVAKLTNEKNSIPLEWTLEDYVTNNKDLFEFQAHYDNWINTEKPFPCLFIKGQSIYKHRYTILKFLDLPVSTEFMPGCHRSSNWINEKAIIKRGLYDIYGGFCDLVESNPDIMLQEKDSTKLIKLSQNSINPFSKYKELD